MRRLARSGYAVRHVALGPERREHAALAAGAGLDARAAELEPSWREADALVLTA
jgi:hypothetical protein